MPKLPKTAENVELAVKQFYAMGGIGLPKHSDSGPGHWLTHAQEDEAAWIFTWVLLEPGKTLEVRFFGANALARKVSKQFHEVLPQDFPHLQEKLIQLFRQSSIDSTPKVVMTRLAVAVAALMVRGCAAQFWADPVGDLMNILRADLEARGVSTLPAYMELLTIVPEEFATQVLPNMRRKRVRGVMANQVPQVLQLVVQVLQAPQFPADIQEQAVRCLTAWVKFGLPSHTLEEIIDLLLPKIAEDPAGAEVYLDVIAAVVSHKDLKSQPNTVLNITAKLTAGLGAILEKLMGEESFEVASPVAAIFITIGETHPKAIINWTLSSEQSREQAMRLISLLLAISSCPHQYPTVERISEMPLNFW